MGYAKLEVLAVGDGACSVLTSWPRERVDRPLTVIDCGNYRGVQSDPAVLLSAHSSGLASIEAVAVSHFDQDHWAGFMALTPGMAPGMAGATVRLLSPKMPKPLTASLLALLGPIGGSGSAALDLARHFRGTLGAASVSMIPLDNTAGPITLSDESFDVLWPPPVVLRTSGAGRVIRDVRELARDLARSGAPELQENLDTASRALDLEDELIESDSSDAPTLRELVVPANLRKRYADVRRAAQRANNDLSLALASREGGLLALGDLGGLALRRAVRPIRKIGFATRLAPHHGSRHAAFALPSARWCIAQTGPRHHAQWAKRHTRRPCPADVCRSTEVHGTFA